MFSKRPSSPNTLHVEEKLSTSQELQVRATEPQIELLKISKLGKSQNTTAEAFKDDPFYKYTRNTPSWLTKRLVKGLWWTILARATLTGFAYTVNDGDAVLLIVPPPADSPTPPLLKRIFDRILASLQTLLFRLCPLQILKREREFQETMQKVVDGTFAERAKEMIYVDWLAASPSCQGRGYGSALLRIVTDMADAKGRAVYLVSSCASHTPFYNRFGFVTVTETTLGADNPTWKEKPIVMPLMVREPKENNEEESSGTL
ncbi:hypothetical protein DFH11DRAFT_216918 [Phellopilus nigrolimitatus]|nr:hypothetical protein DFH11DRAFT_216918 [Phellopilus nigrolimitatus]